MVSNKISLCEIGWRQCSQSKFDRALIFAANYSAASFRQRPRCKFTARRLRDAKLAFRRRLRASQLVLSVGGTTEGTGTYTTR